jgi:UrcA family protein
VLAHQNDYAVNEKTVAIIRTGELAMYAPTSIARQFGLALLGLVGTIGLAATAQAGDPEPVKHDDVVVRYADLDLTSGAGTQVLYARLSFAAKKACGNEPRLQELRASQLYRECFDRTLDKAVRKIGNPQVQALHDARSNSAVG